MSRERPDTPHLFTGWEDTIHHVLATAWGLGLYAEVASGKLLYGEHWSEARRIGCTEGRKNCCCNLQAREHSAFLPGCIPDSGLFHILILMRSLTLMAVYSPEAKSWVNFDIFHVIFIDSPLPPLHSSPLLISPVSLVPGEGASGSLCLHQKIRLFSN